MSRRTITRSPGYHPAGARAIRIDMLERLADLLRAKDSRAGFEATPDMLSITGMTLEQFADLMGGLGYRGEKGERPKVRPEAAAATPPADDTATAQPEAPAASDDAVEAPTATEPTLAVEAVAEPTVAADETAESAPAEAAPAEMEAFYTFTWAPRPRGGEGRGPRRERNEGRGRAPQAAAEGQPDTARPPRGDRPPRPEGERRKDGPPRDGFKGKPKGKGGKPGDRGNDRPRDTQPKTFEARPPREQKIDPDNPFAVLAALKTRS